ncbi:gamma-glutamyltransferase [Bacillus sp. FJAT-27225]|uniref:gamma-glutamyltransferase family protein n=1 Tax=Bacillus sp. FJAT-27225 TaxID=1743144 RepID=UPI00080C245D|nr:gamma-glutamyltransferase family protein [Bacillus sp. FJAT-27225]OCA82425.1 gamma-glutamyltransferase [Bacillus sp. FJAT-27225]
MSLLTYPFSSRRMATVARNGMVATSQPLAAQAGLQILQQGGNAIDAAIATAACLTVVEPTSNGIGGDAFALVWTKGELHGLNASGPAPQSLSIEILKELGYEKMPVMGWIPVNVPGIPSAWAVLSEGFGRLPLTEVLKPAIEYARNGYPISPILGKYWAKAFQAYKARATGPEFEEWFRVFAPDGKAPEIGEMWKSEDHAKTLQEIAETNAESFYRGKLAEKIAAASIEQGGFLRKEDLASYRPEWVKPISVNYKGYDIWEIPPNGQGLVALMALNILKEYTFTHREDADAIHTQLEAMKQAFSDGKTYITDQKTMKANVADLLSEDFSKAAREKIKPTAQIPEPGTLPKGGTVYLATADADGNMVSFIQSNYMGFGSGVVVPGTGIALQNRGYDFSLDPEHENALAPGKKTYHTIIPGFITKDGGAVGPFGVMGGYMMPQGHVQVAMNMIDFGMNPQAALDAPRWQWIEGKRIEVEHEFPNHLVHQLAEKGHQISVAYDSGRFGRGQVIVRNPETGVLTGGTEHRTDGSIACW